VTSVVWIDRRLKSVTNNWSAGRPQRSYYDYGVHVLKGDQQMSAETLLQIFYGNDHRDSVVLAQAQEYATKIAAIGDANGPLPIKQAWEEGVIHFLVTATVAIDAATPEEAEERFRYLYNIRNSGVRVRVEEG
jgi:hypothetical protein